MFYIAMIVIAALTGIIYAIVPIPEVLWFGGTLLAFWIFERLRQEIEDNIYINAALISVMSVFALIAQIFLIGTIAGYVHYFLTALFLCAETLSHRDYLSKHIDERDFAPIRRNQRYTKHEKNYHMDVVAEGNRAAIILILLFMLACMTAIAALCYVYSLWFVLLAPVFITLANMVAIFSVQLAGVQPPHGYSCHEEVTNLGLGYLYLVKKLGCGILAVLLAPVRFVVFIAKKIAGLFIKVRDGGTIRVGIAFWILLGLLGVYDIIGFFGLIEEVEEAILSLTVDSFRVEGFHLIKWLFGWFGEWPASFFNDVIMALPKLVLIIIAVVLDLVLLILGLILWLLCSLFLSLAAAGITGLVPLLLLAGAIVFLVIYFIDSNRDGCDVFKLILWILAALSLTVLYYLFLADVIKVF